MNKKGLNFLIKNITFKNIEKAFDDIPKEYDSKELGFLIKRCEFVKNKIQQ